MSIIAISGISGAGKSTIGKMLAKKLNATFIDQDWFNSSNKQKVILSNGSTVTNYDCDDAFNIKNFNDAISSNKRNNLVIVGYNLRYYFFFEGNKPTIHFNIVIPKELSLKTRLAIKPFSDERRANEKLFFNEYLYPYYQDTLKNSDIDHFINGVIDNKRKTIEDILNYILIIVIVSVKL